VSKPQFRLLPPPARGNPLWGGLSLMLHLAIGIVTVLATSRTFVVEERRTLVALLPPGMTGPREYLLPEFAGVPEGGGGGAAGQRITGIVPSARIDTMLPPLGPAMLITDITDLLRLDTLNMPGPPGLRRLIGPEFGDGRLWVRTAEAELGVVGPSSSIETHIARVEAAVRERIQAYIDTMPRDSFALPPPARWTTEIDGNTWGIDGQWIYLGDIKLPTALLALLPFPQGNIEQAQAAAELQRMRGEIIDVARRAESAEDFRRYVEELRRRKDAEREEERRRRAARDTIKP
jgi:hypothetical protein